MSPRAQVYSLGFFLIIVGLGLVAYKHIQMGLPVVPGEYQTVWTIEAKIDFTATGDPVTASLALPKTQSNVEVLNEVFSSSGYGFTFASDEGHERAVWTRRQASGHQSLYYKLDVYQKDLSPFSEEEEFSLLAEGPDWSGARKGALRSAAEALIERSRNLSSEAKSFASQLILKFNDPQSSDAKIIKDSIPGSSNVERLLDLFAYADLPAHIVRGIYLEDDRSRIQASELIEFFDGKRWLIVHPQTGRIGLPKNFLIWQQGDKSMLDVVGGRNSRVSFSVLANDVPARDVALTLEENKAGSLADYSIYSLPIAQQSVFKFILLVPIGTLVVIFMRVIIGVRTAGTFMPVLLAIAFIQTTLITGVIIFLMILAVGLWVRTYLSRLDLLLISRIAAVVVIVVGMMVLISIVSYRMGYDQALTVTFFPMIIIAWTIEHMSILWEDDGPGEVLIQTTGSLVVAVLCYLVMTNNYVEHWTFNFPEVLLVSLGMIIIMGHYTGYRLTELLRFRHMGK
jgi:hypothetical protein